MKYQKLNNFKTNNNIFVYANCKYVVDHRGVLCIFGHGRHSHKHRGFWYSTVPSYRGMPQKNIYKEFMTKSGPKL